jgi:hypothetical protein
VAALQLLGGDIGADVAVIDELDALLGQQRDPSVDDRLLKLGVRDPEAQQAARALVSLVDGDQVPALVQLGGDGEAGGTRSDDRDRTARAAIGRIGDDPSLVEGAGDDRRGRSAR